MNDPAWGKRIVKGASVTNEGRCEPPHPVVSGVVIRVTRGVAVIRDLNNTVRRRSVCHLRRVD